MKKTFLLTFLLSLACAIPSFAMEPIVLKEGWGKEYPGLHLEYLEDERESFSIDDILANNVPNQFRPSETKYPNIGITSSIYWVRFDLENATSREQETYLEAWQAFERMDVYVVREGAVVSHKMIARTIPFGEREVKFHNGVFRNTLSPGEKATVYVRIKMKLMNFPLILRSAEAYNHYIITNSLLMGVVYGIIFIMAFYNLFIFLFLRDKAYLYYVLFLIAGGVSNSAANSIAFQFLWPDSPWWEMHSIPILAGCCFAFALVFAISFLQMKETAPKLCRFLTFMVFVYAMQILIGFFHVLFAYKLMILASIITSIAIILAGIISLRKGYTSARYFLAGWSIFSAMIFFRMNSTLGIFPVSFLTVHGSQIAFALDAVILSLALADRINLLKTEKLQVQREMIDAQRVHTEELERKVDERTTELERAKTFAESANKSKSEFLSIMSHEIRTPLNPIIALTHLILKTNLDGRQRDYIEKIQTASKSLLGIINDILDFSKIEAGKLNLEQVEFSLVDVLRDLSGLYSVKSRERGLEFTTSHQEGMPDMLIGDRLRLEQVLSNLTSNAIKFTEKGSVNIGVEVIGRTQTVVSVRFSVRDTGIGIPAGLQGKLFQSFIQADSSTTRKYGGSGLGLSICNRLVSLMGGTITLESEVGKGSVFSFTLDFIYGEASLGEGRKVAMKLQTHDMNLNARRLPLLVVDDNEVNLMVAQELLEDFGFPVTVANSGKDALRILERNHFSLIFMDIQMPEMDGYETAKRIRENSDLPEMPIIALTAHAMEEIREKCIDAGMNDLITKPIEPKKLEGILSRWLMFERQETDFPQREGMEDVSKPLAAHPEREVSFQARPIHDEASKTTKAILPEAIPGVNIAEFVENMQGNEAFCLKLLHKFHDLNKGVVVELREKLASGHEAEAARMSHKLVGGAGAICAMDLSRAARRLENALEGKEKGIETYIDELDAAFHVVMSSILSLQDNGNVSGSVAKRIALSQG